MLGIFMHNIKDWSGQIDISGNNQFGELGKNPMGEAVYFWQIYPTFHQDVKRTPFGCLIIRHAKACIMALNDYNMLF